MSRILVLGSGMSGIAAARLAKAKGHSVTLFDEADSPEVMLEFATSNGDWDPTLLDGVDLVVASPGFPERSLPVVESLEAGIEVISEVEWAFRHLSCPVIAVTGTNGKTSVTEATSMILDASGLDAPATGNIGAALSDFATADHDVLVVEVSSFQLRFTETFHPQAAAITNVAVDHLDWHGSAIAYRDAKAKIFQNQSDEDLLVYDADDAGATGLASAAPSRTLPISGHSMPDGGAGVVGDQLVVGDVAIDISELRSDDPTHLANLAAAGSLALNMGATAAGFVQAASVYSAGEHRRQVVATADGIDWVNDSKATNPHAAIASIRSFDSVILIAGGLDKGLDLASVVVEPNLKLVLGIGEAGPGLAQAAGETGRVAGTLEVAVEMAAQAASRGDTVLLAPAGASFDQFESYGHRGDRFAELARSVSGGDIK